MTYRPVPDSDKKAQGRKPLSIPQALLGQLHHSKATGARCVIDIQPGDEDDIAELKRQLIRAGYRHFPDDTINKRRRKTANGEQFIYWVSTTKRGRGGNVQN